MIHKSPERVSQMSAQEAEYLEDIKGLIDFVIRNRLRFDFVAAKLARDMRVLEAHGKLSAALAAGRKLHVMGGRLLTPDAFGVSDEDEDQDQETTTQSPDENHALHEK